MNATVEKVKEVILSYRSSLILGACLLLSVIINCVSIKSCVSNKNIGNNNVIALTDTIEYYKSKSGDIVASKTLLQGDLSTLKLANDSLYRVIKDMKVKDPTSVVYIKSYIDNPKLDTVWAVVRDTVTNTLRKDFAFNDEYRTLEGYVTSTDTTLGVNIEKDQVYFDYTLAVEDNKVLLKTNNPYLKYNEITGLTIPKTKKKWSVGVGPQIGYGYDFVAKKVNPYVGIGVSINYNLFSW